MWIIVAVIVQIMVDFPFGRRAKPSWLRVKGFKMSEG